MLRIGLALLAACLIVVAALLLVGPGDEPAGTEAAIAPPPAEPRLTDQMAAQKVVDAYLSALHGLPARMPDNPTPALKSDSEKQAYLRGLRGAALNAYLDCAGGEGRPGAPALDGAGERPSDYAFVGARREGERVRVAVEEQGAAPRRVEFTVSREGDAWRIDGSSALDAAPVEGCR